MNNDQLKELPIYSSLNKPILIAGGERDLMLFSSLIAFAMIFVAMSWQSAFLGVTLWLFLSMVLRMMAKKDPLLSKIYTRQIKYQKYYPAVASARSAR